MSLETILSKAQTIRISKNKLGIITLSFSLLEGDYENTGISAEEQLNASGEMINLKLVGRHKQRSLVYLSYKYDPFEDFKITKTLRFLTISKNLKNVYDNYFMFEPFMANYQDTNMMYFIKEVDNIYDIDGWSVREIFDKLKYVLPPRYRIDDISLPSFMDYKLSMFQLKMGSNIISAIQSLFPNFIVSVSKIGNSIVISSNINRTDISSAILNNFEYCIEDEYSIEQYDLSNMFLVGDYSTPEYLEGLGGRIQELNYQYGEDKIEKEIMLNEIGREFTTIKTISVKKIKVNQIKYSRGLLDDITIDTSYIIPTSEDDFTF